MKYRYYTNGEIKMEYKESFCNLIHGTSYESATKILKDGFKISGDDTSWCGKGVYFYDVKSKAWWSANRTCADLKKRTGIKHKSAIVFADIKDLAKNDIFDLRSHSDLLDFKIFVDKLLKSSGGILRISELQNDEERIIAFRSMLISYYTNSVNKKLVIGTFKQREQSSYNDAVNFAESLNLIFGAETIYCVKDINILSNLRIGGN